MYKGQARRGRPPYEPQVLLKMLFLSYLYNVSERSMGEFADTNLLAWRLCCRCRRHSRESRGNVLCRRGRDNARRW